MATLAPTTATVALWYGPAPSSCAAYPRADVLFYPPTGYVGTTSASATLAQTTQGAGDCPAESSLYEGVWARYRPGAD